MYAVSRTCSLVVCAVAISGACDSNVPAVSEDGVVTRDSAGITILENPAEGRWEPGEEWSVIEAVSIGDVTGTSEYTFNRIGAVSIGASGRVYVLDSGDKVVKTYDSEGTHLFTFGGEGEGPAEFQSPAILENIADTLVVFDWRLLKFAYFSGDGELIRTDRTELSVFEYGFPALMVPIPGGFGMVLGTGCSMPAPEDPRPKWKFMVAGRSGAVRDTVALLTDDSSLAIYGSTFCYSRHTLAQPAPVLAIAPGGLAAFGTGATYEIRVFRLAAMANYEAPGELLSATDADRALPEPDRIIRRNAPAIPLTDVEVDEYLDNMMPDSATMEDRVRFEAIEAALDTIGFPDTHPAFNELQWDDSGNLWVRRPAPATATSNDWDVFDPDGIYLGAIELRVGLTVHAITDEIVWAGVSDELDVQHLKVYRITR